MGSQGHQQGIGQAAQLRFNLSGFPLQRSELAPDVPVATRYVVLLQKDGGQFRRMVTRVYRQTKPAPFHSLVGRFQIPLRQAPPGPPPSSAE